MPGNFQEIPLSVHNSWPEPNFIDPVRRPWLPAFAITWQSVSTILVFGRFYLRAKKQAGPFGLDDIFIALAWLFSIGLTTCAWIDAEWYDLDRHTWDVKLEHYTGAALMGWISQVLFLFSTCATKVSILLFYRRMAIEVARKWMVAIWAALAFTGAYLIAILLAYCLVCRPLSSYWLSYDYDYTESYTCADAHTLNPAIGVLSVVSDIYAVLLPCVMLAHYDLNIGFRQRLGLNAVFALGALVAGAGIARTYYLTELGYRYDTSWVGFDLFVWSIVECQLAIICACAPSLRAFLRKYLISPLRSSRDRSNRGITKVPERETDGRRGTYVNDYVPSTKRYNTVDDQSLAETYGDDAAVELEDTGRGWHDERGARGNWPMGQLGRYSSRQVRSSDGTESISRDGGDPRRQHDVDNAV